MALVLAEISVDYIKRLSHLGGTVFCLALFIAATFAFRTAGAFFLWTSAITSTATSFFSVFFHIFNLFNKLFFKMA